MKGGRGERRDLPAANAALGWPVEASMKDDAGQHRDLPGVVCNSALSWPR